MAQQDDEPEAPRTRRERGVLAQREYRKRQASKTQALQDENARLKTAIAGINSALALHGSRSQDLISAIQHAKEAAGVAGSDNVVASADGSGENARWASASDVTTDLSQRLGEQGRASRNLPASNINFDDGTTPPEGSFAWCIYWRALSYQVSVFDYGGSPARDVIISNAAQVDMAMQLWVPIEQQDMFDRLWDRRLRFKKMGGREVEVFARYKTKAASFADVNACARAEYLDLRQRKFWRSAAAVEKIVFSILNEDDMRDFQDVLRGVGNARTVEMVLELIESLAQNYFCMGEGPMWSCLWVHMAAGAWIRKLRDGGEDVRML